ncbi:MAG: glycosyltransferase family 4 protein, partial [Chloroflexi bacterium]|nr:glycosyltransferase family 4 protein [Chloroflexota bacterium]
VLHLSQYFPPEAGAVQVRAWTIAKTLAAQGHQVTVLTEIPNHPSGIVQSGYRGKLWVREVRENVEVIHLWVKTSTAKNFRTRIAFYLSYMVMAIVAGLLRGRFDVIFANSPPLFVAIAGWLISLVRRTPFVMEVQDLWPESAVVLGELRNPRYIRWAEWFEAKCYRRASRIITVTQGICDRLVARNVPPAKVTLIPNGSNLDIFQPDPEGGACLRAELGLQNKFVALYAGIHGLAQDLETLLEAARLLTDEPDIRLVLVGEGPKKAELLALHQQLGLTNVLMLPGQALERMPAYLSMADVALVPLRKVDLFLGALPTKIFDAWACQKPTLIGVDGEARAVLEQAGAGLFVEPEQPQALAHMLRRLHHKRDTLAQMGLRGRQAVLERYTLQTAARQIETILKDTTLLKG